MKILCLGDIVGKPGREVVKEYLSRKGHKYDFIVANGENSAAGFGITSQIAEELFELGIDVITTGNHIWNQKDIYSYLNSSNKIIRPYNYSKNSPGKGIAYSKTKNGKKALVINMQGNVFMGAADNAFIKMEEALNEAKNYSNIIIVDFHAEATSEKIALGWFLDGKVSLVYGTHTHILTADEKIMPNGTGYISDIGMCGPYDSVIGMKKEAVLSRFLTGMPSKFEVASDNVKVSGIEVELNNEGKCKSIQKILLNIGEIRG